MRQRRSKEEARAQILDAATTLLAARGPDAVGLKAVAAASGVSHALVTHYFGTYEGLVEEVLATRSRASRHLLLTRLAASTDIASLADSLFDALSDPLFARLAVWASLTGRDENADFFARQEQGMKVVADALSARLGGAVPRERIEHAMLLFVTATLGYSLGEDVLWASVGRKATHARRAGFKRYLAEILADLGPLPP